MDRSHGKDPGTARGTRKVLEPHAMDKGLREGLEYLKEATVVMDTMNNKGIKADDIIKAVTMKIGKDKLLAVRPKNSLEYELTLTCADECDDLIDGVEIKGQLCVVRRLELKECVVSFIHLPAYVEDETIEDKLKLWGVTPITKIKRRLYPGTDIADGTRYVKIRFPKEVTSLPYSAKFETSDGERYFRVIHDGQIKLCRMCMQPGHIFKDCPDFKCFECAEQGHFARECKAEKCLDCNKVFMKCDCESESEEDQSFDETEAGNEGSLQSEVEQTMRKERDGLNSKDFKKDSGKKNNMMKEAEDGMGKMEKVKADKNRTMENEMNVCSVSCFDTIRRKKPEEKSLCEQNLVEMEEEDQTTTRDRDNGNKDNVNKKKRENIGGHENAEKGEEKQHRDEEKLNGKPEMNGKITHELSMEIMHEKEQICSKDQGENSLFDADFDQVKVVDVSAIRSKNKEKENVVKNKLKNQTIGGHKLKYKKIPNLKLVLKKQKLRRKNLEKKRKVIEYYLD